MPFIRNLQIGYLMVEGASEEEDLEDPYQGGLPTCLPHTLESFKAGSKQSPGFPKRGRAHCSTFFMILYWVLNLFLSAPESCLGADPMKHRSKGFACGNEGIFFRSRGDHPID